MEGSTFCVCDDLGDVGGAGEGVFAEDTRMLARKVGSSSSESSPPPCVDDAIEPRALSPRCNVLMSWARSESSTVGLLAALVIRRLAALIVLPALPVVGRGRRRVGKVRDRDLAV